MTLYDFIALDEDAKEIAVLDGTYLGSGIEDGYTINLYDLGGFYVEVFLLQVKTKQIKKMRPFKSQNHLIPYLQCINISTLTDLL